MLRVSLQSFWITVVCIRYTDDVIFVVMPGFLELINNMLTSGIVPALYPDDEKDGIIGQVRIALCTALLLRLGHNFRQESTSCKINAGFLDMCLSVHTSVCSSLG